MPLPTRLPGIVFSAPLPPSPRPPAPPAPPFPPAAASVLIDVPVMVRLAPAALKIPPPSPAAPWPPAPPAPPAPSWLLLFDPTPAVPLPPLAPLPPTARLEATVQSMSVNDPAALKIPPPSPSVAFPRPPPTGVTDGWATWPPPTGGPTPIPEAPAASLLVIVTHDRVTWPPELSSPPPSPWTRPPWIVKPEIDTLPPRTWITRSR